MMSPERKTAGNFAVETKTRSSNRSIGTSSSSRQGTGFQSNSSSELQRRQSSARQRIRASRARESTAFGSKLTFSTVRSEEKAGTQETDKHTETAKDIFVEKNAMTSGVISGRNEPKQSVKSIGASRRFIGNKYFGARKINPLHVTISKRQMKDLKEAYELLEDPKTGLIPIKNVSAVIRACGFQLRYEEIRDILEQINPSSPDSLSFEEFVYVIKYKLENDQSQEEIERAFKLMNVNQTGVITLSDLRETAKIVDYYLTDEELLLMLNEAQPHSGGQVTMANFVRFIRAQSCHNEPEEVAREKSKI